MKSLQILSRSLAILAFVAVAGNADTTKTVPSVAKAKVVAAKAVDTTKAKAAVVATKAVDTAKAVVAKAVEPKPAAQAPAPAKVAEPAKPVEAVKPAEAPKAVDTAKAKPAKAAKVVDTTKAKKAKAPKAAKAVDTTKAKVAEPKSDTAKAASVTGGKTCDEVKSAIEEKVRAKGNKSYTLEVVAAADVKDQKVVGSCAGGSKKLVKAK